MLACCVKSSIWKHKNLKIANTKHKFKHSEESPKSPKQHKKNTMIQSAFPSFYDQKREFSSSWLLKKILSDFFDAKSVSGMKIFSYAFSFSESIFRVYFKKAKDYWNDYWNSDEFTKRPKRHCFCVWTSKICSAKHKKTHNTTHVCATCQLCVLGRKKPIFDQKNHFFGIFKFACDKNDWVISS